jgi:hypothetical protein
MPSPGEWQNSTSTLRAMSCVILQAGHRASLSSRMSGVVRDFSTRRLSTSSELRGATSSISDALYAAMVADALRAEEVLGAGGPGGETGNGLVACGDDSHLAKPALTPQNRLFGQATPGPKPRLGLSDRHHAHSPRGNPKNVQSILTSETKRTH